jgi:alkylation response protein AidB-like acyl-CoA dehydrogenase
VQVGADALIGPAGGALPLIERAVDYANAALCAEAVGIMAALNEVTLEYLKTRKQFGVPIGKFQALQHRMADMVIATEQARSMAILAAVRADSIPMPPSAAARRRRQGLRPAIGAPGRPAGGATAWRHGRHRRTQRRPLLQAPDHDGLTFGDVDYHLGRFSATRLLAA